MNKLEERLVSFETAKLAKEKGFESVIGLGHRKPRGNYYNSNGELNGDVTIELVNKDFKSISAPTQSLLQKWLREKHKMFVTVCINPDQYRGTINYSADILSINVDKEGLRLMDGFTIYQSYENALEEGLQEALKLIK